MRTITHAYSLAHPGDRILVLPGIYTDYASGWGLHLGADGTASNPIVLKSQVKGGAIIDGGDASDRNEGIYLDGSHNVIDGFEIRNNPNGGICIYGNNNQVLNCEIDHNGNPASTSTNGRDGIYSDSSTSGNSYLANSIHDNGRAGSNLDHGLYLCGKDESVINNLLFANAASGLQVAGYTTVSNLKVYNNVMALNGTSGIILWQALSGVDIKNNIIYQNGHYGVGSYDAHGSGVVLDHNLAYGNGYGDYNFNGGASDYTYSQGTAISGQPLLVDIDLAGFDAHLSAGSPGLNAGLNLSSVFTTDKDGTPRPASGSWDLGAYQSLPNAALALSSPQNGSTVSGSSVLVTATAAGLLPSLAIQFKLDGQDLGTALLLSPYQVTWDTTKTANGTHTLTAIGTDLLGNQTLANPISVIVANTVAPVLGKLSVGQSGSSIRITWPKTLSGYQLEYKSMLTLNTTWTAVTGTPALVGTNYVLTEPTGTDGKIYRLRHP